MKDNYILALDEYFCANYSDYVRISAIEGYKMPELLVVGKDGNISRRDSRLMRICHQENAAEILQTLKEESEDTDFTFSFCFRSLRDKFHDLKDKNTFSKILPTVLSHVDETVESAGEKLTVEPRFWTLIAKGKVYPEKNTVLALALTCRLSVSDANNLLATCGFTLQQDSIRDVVVGYLLEQRIFNEEMRDKCLQEYGIKSLPIKRQDAPTDFD
ncbi:MAG: hypothetical protein J6C93_00635 [Clostridia bacterium]|nr:hypothetical protein [Clostridia bacterium]